MGIRIGLKHLTPFSLIRNIGYALAGHRLCKKINVPFRSIFPSCLNSMTTAWNLFNLGVPKARAIIDVGAHNSEMIKLLQLFNSAEDIYSFEPLTSCNPTGHVYRIALSDYDGKGALAAPSYDKYGAKLVGKTGTNEQNQQTVEVKRFDALGINLQQAKKPILLKIDVEGHELNVLKGFGDQLDHIDYILLELQNAQNMDRPYDALDLFFFLKNRGFQKSTFLYGWSDGINSPAYFDVFFERNTTPAHATPS